MTAIKVDSEDEREREKEREKGETRKVRMFMFLCVNVYEVRLLFHIHVPVLGLRRHFFFLHEYCIPYQPVPVPLHIFLASVR